MQRHACFLFKVPTNDKERIRRQIDRLVNAKRLYKIVQTGHKGVFRIEFDQIEAKDDLYANRKKLRIEGRATVVVRKRHIFGESRMLIKNDILKMVERKLNDFPIIKNLFEIVTMKRDGPDKTMVVAKDFSALMKFDEQLRRIMFTDCQEGDDKPNGMDVDAVDSAAKSYKDQSFIEDFSAPVMLETTPNLQHTEVPEQVKVVVWDDTHAVEIQEADILNETTEAIVLPTKSDLVLWDDNLQQRLIRLAGDVYVKNRDDYVKTNGPLSTAKCASCSSSGTFGSKQIMHLSTETELFEAAQIHTVMSHLTSCYVSILMEAARLQIKSISILILADTFRIDESARAAVKAIKQCVDCSGAICIPTQMRFVYPSDQVATLFGSNFSYNYEQLSVNDGKGEDGKISTSINKKDLVFVNRSARLSMELVSKPKEIVDVWTKKLDYGQEDDGKLSQATGTSKPKSTTEKIERIVDPIEPESKSRISGPPLRQYGKLSLAEKTGRKAMTWDEKKKLIMSRTSEFIRDLGTWPNQLSCAICNREFKLTTSTDKSINIDNPREMCQCCNRSYHLKCFDSNGGVCSVCIGRMSMTDDGVRCSDQPDGGRMQVRVIDNPKLTPEGFPDTRGHIEIGYTFSTGTQRIRDPQPGQMFYGSYRAAYLPNNDDGYRISRMLKIAFERGLLFKLKQIPNGYNVVDYGVDWGCIPLKISLTGGRDKWGYPDETYLKRIEALLGMFGIEEKEKGADVQK